MNSFEGNEAWNNFKGINLVNQQFAAGMYPSVPGGVLDTTVDGFKMKPVVFKGQVVAANSQVGLEMWATTRFLDEDLIAAHNADMQVFAIVSDHIEVYLRNPTLLCPPRSNGIGLHSALAYVGTMEIDGGGTITGCAVGIARGGGASFMKVAGTPTKPLVLQNQVNVDLLTRVSTFTDVLHKPLLDYPHQYILFGDGSIWNGADPLPNVGVGVYFPQLGSSLKVKNWQGTGQDYLLFYKQQLGSNPSWYSAPNRHGYNTPEKGLTMLQSWQQYGISYRGDVLKESEAVAARWPGERARADADSTVSFSPPRAICSFPTLREPAIVTADGVFINCQLTGDPTGASDIMALSVDGDPPYFLAPTEYTNQDGSVLPDAACRPGLARRQGVAHEGWRTGRAARFGDDVPLCRRAAEDDATRVRADTKRQRRRLRQYRRRRQCPTPTPTARADANSAARADANSAAHADANSAAYADANSAARADANSAARADANSAAGADANSAAARADSHTGANTRPSAGASTDADTNAEADSPAAEADGGDDAKTAAHGNTDTGTHDQTPAPAGTTGGTVVDVSRRGGHAIRGSLSDMYP